MRRIASLTVLLAAGLSVLLGGTGPASAQQQVGINPSRDCQIVRSCNFSRHGEVRGCLSSYTCRTCKLVAARCTVGNRTKCREFVCSWGG